MILNRIVAGFKSAFDAFTSVFITAELVPATVGVNLPTRHASAPRTTAPARRAQVTSTARSATVQPRQAPAQQLEGEDSLTIIQRAEAARAKRMAAWQLANETAKAKRVAKAERAARRDARFTALAVVHPVAAREADARLFLDSFPVTPAEESVVRTSVDSRDDESTYDVLNTPVTLSTSSDAASAVLSDSAPSPVSHSAPFLCSACANVASHPAAIVPTTVAGIDTPSFTRLVDAVAQALSAHRQMSGGVSYRAPRAATLPNALSSHRRVATSTSFHAPPAVAPTQPSSKYRRSAAGTPFVAPRAVALPKHPRRVIAPAYPPARRPQPLSAKLPTGTPRRPGKQGPSIAPVTCVPLPPSSIMALAPEVVLDWSQVRSCQSQTNVQCESPSVTVEATTSVVFNDERHVAPIAVLRFDTTTVLAQEDVPTADACVVISRFFESTAGDVVRCWIDEVAVEPSPTRVDDIQEISDPSQSLEDSPGVDEAGLQLAIAELLGDAERALGAEPVASALTSPASFPEPLEDPLALGPAFLATLDGTDTFVPALPTDFDEPVASGLTYSDPVEDPLEPGLTFVATVDDLPNLGPTFADPVEDPLTLGPSSLATIDDPTTTLGPTAIDPDETIEMVPGFVSLEHLLASVPPPIAQAVTSVPTFPELTVLGNDEVVAPGFISLEHLLASVPPPIAQAVTSVPTFPELTVLGNDEVVAPGFISLEQLLASVPPPVAQAVTSVPTFPELTVLGNDEVVAPGFISLEQLLDSVPPPVAQAVTSVPTFPELTVLWNGEAVAPGFISLEQLLASVPPPVAQAVTSVPTFPELTVLGNNEVVAPGFISLEQLLASVPPPVAQAVTSVPTFPELTVLGNDEVVAPGFISLEQLLASVPPPVAQAVTSVPTFPELTVLGNDEVVTPGFISLEQLLASVPPPVAQAVTSVPTFPELTVLGNDEVVTPGFISLEQLLASVPPPVAQAVTSVPTFPELTVLWNGEAVAPGFISLEQLLASVLLDNPNVALTGGADASETHDFNADGAELSEENWLDALLEAMPDTPWATLLGEDTGCTATDTTSREELATENNGTEANLFSLGLTPAASGEASDEEPLDSPFVTSDAPSLDAPTLDESDLATDGLTGEASVRDQVDPDSLNASITGSEVDSEAGDLHSQALAALLAGPTIHEVLSAIPVADIDDNSEAIAALLAEESIEAGPEEWDTSGSDFESLNEWQSGGGCALAVAVDCELDSLDTILASGTESLFFLPTTVEGGLAASLRWRSARVRLGSAEELPFILSWSGEAEPLEEIAEIHEMRAIVNEANCWHPDAGAIRDRLDVLDGSFDVALAGIDGFLLQSVAPSSPSARSGVRLRALLARCKDP